MFFYLLAGFVIGAVLTFIAYRALCAGTLNVLKSDDSVIDMYLALDKPVEYVESQPFVKLRVRVKNVNSRK